jgi:membrane-associated phospholipid phosphatase
MTLQARWAGLVVVFLVQFLYFPINRSIQGGRVLATAWDAHIPLWQIWVIPYLLSLAWWAGCFIWAACKMDDDLYRAFIASLIMVMLASYGVYILYPTYVIRPPLEADDWLTRLVGLLYDNDRANNAFPSGHTYNTILIALFWWRWRPRQRLLWATVSLVVLLSTLYTRQHNIPDLIGGVAFACTGYAAGLRWAALRSSGR